MKTAVSVLVLSLLGTISCEIIDISPQVVNGTDADIYDYPFMVSLRRVRNNQNSNMHSCGATLLSENWILTVKML